jgi:hypothetical protein
MFSEHGKDVGLSTGDFAREKHWPITTLRLLKGQGYKLALEM